MTARPVAILGAGGHGRDVHEVLLAVHDHEVAVGGAGYEFVGFFDDGVADHDLLAVRGAACLGPVSAFANTASDVTFVIGIGSPSVRRRIDGWASGLGREATTLVHPRAIVGRFGNRLGAGSLLMANVSMTANARLGRHVHVNQNVTIGHDSVLYDYVTVGAQTVVCGGAQLGEGVEVGSGAVINPLMVVERDAVVGSGAVVTSTVAAGSTVVGVPARPISRRSSR